MKVFNTLKPVALAAMITGSVAVLNSCSVFGNNGDVKEPPYTTVMESGDFEIRRYAPMILAQTTVTGDWDKASSKAFRPLFKYIDGNNSTRTKVAMTSPVFSEKASSEKASSEKIPMTSPVFMEDADDADSTKIPMTAPVFMDGNKNAASKTWTMSFVMPADFTLQNTPRPLNPAVNIVEQPAKKYAVLTYNDVANVENRTRKAAELLDWVRTQELTPVSKVTYAGYNPPFTLPAFRRNEVLIEIK